MLRGCQPVGARQLCPEGGLPLAPKGKSIWTEDAALQCLLSAVSCQLGHPESTAVSRCLSVSH